jgi:hypothetical protein
MVMDNDNVIYYKSAHGQTLKLTMVWDAGLEEYISAFKTILTFATFSEDTIGDVFREAE